MPEFRYQDPFPTGEDTTSYRLLTSDYVSMAEFDGREISDLGAMMAPHAPILDGE